MSPLVWGPELAAQRMVPPTVNRTSPVNQRNPDAPTTCLEAHLPGDSKSCRVDNTNITLWGTVILLIESAW